MTPEARQAIIKHRRTMKDVRRYAREHRAEIDAEWDALKDPRMTLDEHIAAGKADVERWARLQAEWGEG